MQTGQFYFISDDFFLKFDPEKLLMGTKTANTAGHAFTLSEIGNSPTYIGASRFLPEQKNSRTLYGRNFSDKWIVECSSPNAIPSDSAM